MNDFVDYDKKFLNFSMRQSLLTKKDEITYIKSWQLYKNEKCLNKIVSSHLSRLFLRGFIHFNELNKCYFDYTPLKRTNGKSKYTTFTFPASFNAFK